MNTPQIHQSDYIPPGNLAAVSVEDAPPLSGELHLLHLLHHCGEQGVGGGAGEEQQGGEE